MKQYSNLLNAALSVNNYCKPARENMPSTLFAHSLQEKFLLSNGLPILTGKKMPFYSILAELIGFMKGVTDVRKFDKLGTKVWWDNAYKWNIVDDPYWKEESISKEEYINSVNLLCKPYPEGTGYSYDLGRIYSAQWRDWNPKRKSNGITYSLDQLMTIIHSITTNPYSRYHVMTAWNPNEMNNEFVSQPNCHVYFQASCVPFQSNWSERNIRKQLSLFLSENTIDKLLENGYKPDKKLFTHLTQRSCDMFLGVPFNITSYSLFTILLAIFTNSIPWEFSWVGVNSHIYENHLEAVNEYLEREQYQLPKLDISDIYDLSDIEKLETLQDLKEHFRLINYKSGNRIKAELSVGL